MVGRLLSFWEGSFSAAMLVLGEYLIAGEEIKGFPWVAAKQKTGTLKSVTPLSGLKPTSCCYSPEFSEVRIRYIG